MEIENFLLWLHACLRGVNSFSVSGSFPERTSLLVRIATDNGFIGWREGKQWGRLGCKLFSGFRSSKSRVANSQPEI